MRQKKQGQSQLLKFRALGYCSCIRVGHLCMAHLVEVGPCAGSCAAAATAPAAAAATSSGPDWFPLRRVFGQAIAPPASHPSCWDWCLANPATSPRLHIRTSSCANGQEI